MSSRDIPDLTQDVLLAAAKDISVFEHNGRQGAFRAWLRTVTLNRCRRHWNTIQRTVTKVNDSSVEKELLEFADPKSELTDIWNAEHDAFVLKGLFEMLEREFDEQTLQVFLRVTIYQHSPTEVAKDNGWLVGKVYKAKFRIMKRLRECAMTYLD